MKTAINTACLVIVMALSSCTDRTGSARQVEPSLPYPVAETERYGKIPIRMLGDSYCGTISSNPRIQFDCGHLAGALAYGNESRQDGRCAVIRTPERVAVTTGHPPNRKHSNYYPINVYSPDQKVQEEELIKLAYAIESAVLKKK